MDNSYCTLLQLSDGEILTLNEIKTKVKAHLSKASFRTICGQCPWKHLCEPNLDMLT